MRQSNCASSTGVVADDNMALLFQEALMFKNPFLGHIISVIYVKYTHL